MRGQRGLTMIEILIGIALSLLILSAVVTVFVGSSASYRNTESSSAVQESGRIALEYLNRDIRMAGNPGCGNLNFLNHQSALFKNDLVLVSTPGATASVPDAITVTRGSAEFAVVATSPALNQINLVNTGTLGAIAAGDNLLLTDCVSTDVMTVTAVAGNSITGNALTQQFRPGSQVLRLETVAYSVVGGELLRGMNGGAGQAVASGVSNLKLIYGVSNAAARSATSYVAAPTLAQVAETVAVKLTLTIADGQPPVRQEFTSTIALRNRAP